MTTTSHLSEGLRKEIALFIFDGMSLSHAAKHFESKLLKKDEPVNKKTEKRNYFRCRSAFMKFAKSRNKKAFEELAANDIDSGASKVHIRTIQMNKDLFVDNEELFASTLSELKDLGVSEINKRVAACKTQLRAIRNAKRRVDMAHEFLDSTIETSEETISDAEMILETNVSAINKKMTDLDAKYSKKVAKLEGARRAVQNDNYIDATRKR